MCLMVVLICISWTHGIGYPFMCFWASLYIVLEKYLCNPLAIVKLCFCLVVELYESFKTPQEGENICQSHIWWEGSIQESIFFFFNWLGQGNSGPSKSLCNLSKCSSFHEIAESITVNSFKFSRYRWLLYLKSPLKHGRIYRIYSVR